VGDQAECKRTLAKEVFRRILKKISRRRRGPGH